MLTKIAYRQVVKNLEHYKAQDDLDRKEKPDAFPIDWSNPLRDMIERTAKENHQRVFPDTAQQTLAYLADKGLLIPYLGGYAFPGRKLPTKAEVTAKTLEVLRSL